MSKWWARDGGGKGGEEVMWFAGRKHQNPPHPHPHPPPPQTSINTLAHCEACSLHSPLPLTIKSGINTVDCFHHVGDVGAHNAFSSLLKVSLKAGFVSSWCFPSKLKSYLKELSVTWFSFISFCTTNESSLVIRAHFQLFLQSSGCGDVKACARKTKPPATPFYPATSYPLPPCLLSRFLPLSLGMLSGHGKVRGLVAVTTHTRWVSHTSTCMYKAPAHKHNHWF